MADRPALALAFALSAALGYGLIPVLVKIAHLNGVPAIDSTFTRTLAAVVVYTIIVVVWRFRLSITRANAKPLALLSFATFAISTGYLASVQFIPVGLAVIIFFTFPVILLLLSPLVEKAPIGWWRLSLATIAFAGLALAIGPGAGSLDLRGIALAGLASLGAVIQFFAARALSGSMHPISFALIAHAGFLPLVFLLAASLDGGSLAVLDPAHVTSTGYVAVLAMALLYVFTFLLQMTACTLAPASRVAPLFNLEPVTTMGLAAFVLGEKLAVNQYVGGAMVLAAVIAIGLGDRAK